MLDIIAIFLGGFVLGAWCCDMLYVISDKNKNK